MLLFGSVEQLQLLFDSPIIMMDGTFNASPPFFDQVYTIHAIKHETSKKNVVLRSIVMTSVSKAFLASSGCYQIERG